MPMSNVQASALVRDFGAQVGVNDGRLNAIKQLDIQVPLMIPYVRNHFATAQAIVAAAVVGGNHYTAFVNFLTYLRGGVLATRFTEAEMVLVNLGLPWAALTANNYPNTGPLHIAWPHLSAGEKTRVAAYARSRATGSAMKNLIDLGNAAGAGFLGNLQALAAVVDAMAGVRTGDPQRFSGITAATLPNLNTLLGLHAPGTGFAGFVRWGPGDHNSAAANGRWHFLKHVCGVTDGEKDVDLRECELWWRRITIQLTWAQYTQEASKHENTGAIQGWFTGLNNSLSYRHVRAFLERRTLTNNPKVLGHLLATYQAAYENEAIDISRNLTEVFVQSNGEKSFVTGCNDNDDMFVIGRISGGVLGISSCYVAFGLDAKMNAARSNMIWELT